MTTLLDDVTDERSALLAFLAAQRDGLRRTVHGLTEEQADSRPTVSALSLAALIKHATRCEHFWIGEVLMGGSGDLGEHSWEDEYRLLPGETLAEWLKTSEEVAARTEEIVGGLPNLELDAPLPQAPWFPPGSRRSARWILLHLIREISQHAGHADIIRESIDGKTAFELVAESAA